jgi:hypothetical protein
MSQRKSKTLYCGTAILGGIVPPILIVYAVLALAFVEDAVYGTRTVENACKSMGVHGFLEWVADKTLWFLQH